MEKWRKCRGNGRYFKSFISSFAKAGSCAAAFTFGHDWTLEGSGLYGDGAPVE